MTTHPPTENAQDLQTRLQIKLRMCDFTSMYRLLSCANDQRKEAADRIASLEHQLDDASKDAARWKKLAEKFYFETRVLRFNESPNYPVEGALDALFADMKMKESQ